MQLLKQTKGDILVVAAGILWSTFPLITKYSYNSITPLTAIFYATAFSVILFFLIFLYKKEWNYLQQKKGWIFIILVGIINGLLGYSLIFYGLQFTSAVNASIVSIGTEIFFSYIFFGFLFTHKKTNLHEILGATLMVLGTLYIIFPGTFSFNKGDIFIAIAAMIAPIGNFFTQKALQFFSANFIMLFRSIITFVVLGVFCYLFSPTTFSIPNMNILIVLLFNGIILFGVSKLLFIEGFKYISIPRASSFHPLIPIFTICFGFLFFSELPTASQLLGLIPVSIGLFVFFDRLPFVKGSMIEKIKNIGQIP